MSIRKTAAAARRRVLRTLYQRPGLLPSGTPLVSFTFDDFPRTALTVGGRILKSYGARGTYYTAMGLMGTNTELGEQFRRADLDMLLNDGHELANHTFNHVSCRSMPAEQFQEEVQRGQAAIDAVMGKRELRNFAFPFGQVTVRAKQLMSRDACSARGIWRGLNDTKADLNLLLANCLYGGDEARSRVQELILQNERRGSWLIFYTHDVQPTPSPYGCSPELLEFAVSLASRAGAVRTVAEVIAASTLPATSESIAPSSWVRHDPSSARPLHPHVPLIGVGRFNSSPNRESSDEAKH